MWTTGIDARSLTIRFSAGRLKANHEEILPCRDAIGVCRALPFCCSSLGCVVWRSFCLLRHLTCLPIGDTYASPLGRNFAEHTAYRTLTRNHGQKTASWSCLRTDRVLPLVLRALLSRHLDLVYKGDGTGARAASTHGTCPTVEMVACRTNSKYACDLVVTSYGHSCHRPCRNCLGVSDCSIHHVRRTLFCSLIDSLMKRLRCQWSPSLHFVVRSYRC